MIFLHMSWQFFQHYSGQFCGVVFVLHELYKFDIVSLGLAVVTISHAFIIVVYSYHIVPSHFLVL